MRERSGAQLLDDCELKRLAREGNLPEVWRTRVTAACMRPLFSLGNEVTLVRRRPRPGDVVSFVSDDVVVWRRVLRGGPGYLVVRADLAPQAEIWTGDVLGCVVRHDVAHRLAQVAPRLWTRAVWEGALGLARLRAARLRLLSRRPRGREAITVRTLAAEDLPLLSKFGRNVMGLAADLGHTSPDAVLFGAFTPAGELIGHTTLLTGTSPPLSCNTFVSPAWRRCGVGRLLLGAAVREGRRLGLDEIQGTIRARNFGSIRAVQAVGFVRLLDPGVPDNHPEYQRWSIRLTASDHAAPARVPADA